MRGEGRLGQLRHRLGLNRPPVNTVQDEQNLTNFLILVDYVNSLFQAWVSQRIFFLRSGHGQPFLGTQLVLISQALASVADQVQDAYDAMDSVYLGPSERQTITLHFFEESAPITLADLLNWVMDFAANQGPQLLQAAGQDGVASFHSNSTIHRLGCLLLLTMQLSQSGETNPAHPFHTYRVQVALQDLLRGLLLVKKMRDLKPGI